MPRIWAVLPLLLLLLFLTPPSLPPGPAPPVISDAWLRPDKVQPGDLLVIQANATDPAGVASVTADIEGIETVEMARVTGTSTAGTYHAEWKVHDTGLREYNVTLRATGADGLQSTEVLTFWDPVTGLLLFWDGSAPPAGWVNDSDPGGPFDGRFPRGSDAYGGMGGSLGHQHAASVTSGAPSSTGNTGGSGTTTYSTSAHTHSFSIQSQ